MSAIMHFDAAGRMTNSSMVPGVICSAERMTYTNVNKVLNGDPEMTARYAHLNHHFRGMKGLAQLLNARRQENGSIDFDLPERVIEFDDQRRMTGVSRSERNIAHRIIEEFMLAANRAVDHYRPRAPSNRFIASTKSPTLERSYSDVPRPAPGVEARELAYCRP